MRPNAFNSEYAYNFYWIIEILSDFIINKIMSSKGIQLKNNSYGKYLYY